MASLRRALRIMGVFSLGLSALAWASDSHSLLDAMIRAKPYTNHVEHGEDPVTASPHIAIPKEVENLTPLQVIPYLHQRFDAAATTEERLAVLRALQGWRFAFNRHVTDFSNAHPHENLGEFQDRLRQKLTAFYDRIPPEQGLVDLYRKALTSPDREVRESPAVYINDTLIDGHVQGDQFKALLTELMLNSNVEIRVKALSMAVSISSRRNNIREEAKRCWKEAPAERVHCIESLKGDYSEEAIQMRAEALASTDHDLRIAALKSMGNAFNKKQDLLIQRLAAKPDQAADLHYYVAARNGQVDPEIMKAAWKNSDQAGRENILRNGLSLYPRDQAAKILLEASYFPQLQEAFFEAAKRRSHSLEILSQEAQPFLGSPEGKAWLNHFRSEMQIRMQVAAVKNIPAACQRAVSSLVGTVRRLIP